MNKKYSHMGHGKFRIMYHIIFSTKYRKKLLGPIAEDIKSYMRKAESMQNLWRIESMEIDSGKCDYIHFLIKATPTCTVSEIIHKLKQMSTHEVWKNHFNYMSGWYWSGKHHLWTRGYFCSSIGEVSECTLKKYIKQQG